VQTPTAAPRTAPPTTPPGSAPASSAAGESTGSAPAAAASTTTTAPPLRPSRRDAALLQVVEAYELAARDLYQTVLTPPATTGSSGPDDTTTAAVTGDYEAFFATLRENHEGYANVIAGLVGAPAVPRSPKVYDEFVERFASRDTTELAAAAYELESTLVATHPEVIARLDGIDGATTIASIVIVEARQASAAAAVAGNLDDLDAMLVNTATPLELPDLSATLSSAAGTTEG
jgi:Ferritin-like domain